jgi:hypothetical protein
MRSSFLLLLILLTSPVPAADNNGNYAVWGVGGKSCQNYNMARAANNDANFKDFLMGFFTAYNHQADETYSVTNTMTMDEILVWFDNECELKPVSSFEEAIITFILKHYEKRAKFPPGRFGR